METDLKSYIETICEIKTMENELLLFGKVFRFTGEDTELIDIISTDSGEDMPLIKYDTPVKIIFRKGDSLTVAGGNIYICNEKFWRIKDVELYQNFERRGFFRVSTIARGMVSLANKELAVAVAPSAYYPAQLINISLSGVMFSTNHKFEQEEILQLHSLFLSEKVGIFSLVCKIVGVDERDDYSHSYIYRCSFVDMDDRCADQLCKAIFDLQRENIKKMRSRM